MQNVEKAAKWESEKKVRRSKKNSRTSSEIQFKELNKKLKSTLPDQQINSTKPAKTQTNSSQKIENLKQSNKLKKNILITRTLEAFTA